jgi:hypothetical protein
MMKLSLPLSVITAAMVALAPLTTARIENPETLFAEQSYRACADNVSSIYIGSGSIPGSILLTETRAFALIMASDTTIVGAAGALDDVNGGRVAAFTHGGFISAATQGNGLGNMLFNIAKWAGRSDDPKVAIQSGRSELTDLAQLKFDSFSTAPHAITDSEVLNGDLTTSNYDILFAQSAKYDTPAEIAAVRSFLEEGGGVVFYGTSWAFDYPNGFDYELDYAANVVLLGTGVNILGSIDWDYESGPWTVPTNLSDPIVNNAGYAVASLEQHVTAEDTLSSSEETYATDVINQALDDLMDIRKNLTSFFTALDDLAVIIKNETSFVYPSRTNTFSTTANSMANFLIQLENSYALNLPAGQLEAHPGHVDYPGEVPAGAVPLANQVVSVRGKYEGLDTYLIYAGSGADRWTSTALYLIAGTTMTVTIPASMVDDDLSVRVGCHTDNLSSKDSLNRMPQISRSWDLTKEVR